MASRDRDRCEHLLGAGHVVAAAAGLATEGLEESAARRLFAHLLVCGALLVSLVRLFIHQPLPGLIKHINLRYELNCYVCKVFHLVNFFESDYQL